MKMKRRKAHVEGKLARSGKAQFLLVPRGYWRRDRSENLKFLPYEICRAAPHTREVVQRKEESP